MPTKLLEIGPARSILQNTVYALPARAVYAFSPAALEVAATTGFTASQAVSANTPTVVNGGFVRCTTGNTTVRLKAL